MLPKWHAFFGVIFSLILYYFFHASFLNSLIVFLASVFIDVDHYLFGAKRNQTLNLKKIYTWHKNLPKNHKPIMHIFHTIEFTFFIAILAYFFNFFLFILIGMLFHSFSDIIDMAYTKKMDCREFSLVRYTFLSKKNQNKYF